MAFMIIYDYGRNSEKRKMDAYVTRFDEKLTTRDKK
jgi:hypothetical protein